MAKTRTVDVSPFEALVADAIKAFGQDCGYAESMGRAARGIEAKRDQWATRSKLRRFEAEAQERCRAFGTFQCQSVSPCGFGDCRFADPQAPCVVVVSTRGRSTKPQPAAFPHYDLEDVVRATRALSIAV